MTPKKSFWPYFLFGLGTSFQLFGVSLSFTELFVFIAAPFYFIKEYPYLKRFGFMPLLWLSVLTLVGCVVASISNQTPLPAFIRGFASVMVIPCTLIMGCRMLRTNPNGFKYFLVGSVLSMLLCTFIFRRSVEVAIAQRATGGAVDASDIASGALFWVQRVGGVVSLPAKGWYLQCPLVVSVGVLVFMAVFALFITASGRSAALGSLAAAVLILLGRRKQSTMRRLGQHFILLMVIGIVGIVVAKNAYVYTASRGLLGEESRRKYERQSKGKSSMGALLLGGRMEAFCGLIAAFDHPIVGFGPWPRDRNGYTGEFLLKYGNREDYEAYIRSESMRLKLGLGEPLIPCHSYITTFWVNYGIFGLFLWLYILFLIFRFMKNDIWAIPQWYFWIVAAVPAFLWRIFFSPFAERVDSALIITAMLLERAVRMGRLMLPESMVREIAERETK